MTSELQTISDAQGRVTGVIVPIELWREIESKEVLPTQRPTEDKNFKGEPIPGGTATPVLPKGQRRAAIEAGRGSMRGILNSDEFLARRHEEAAYELEKSRQTVWPHKPSENGS